MSLSVIAFLVVTLGLIGAFSLPQYWRRDQAKVHQRIADEFHIDRPGAASALYKNLDALAMAPADEYALLGEKMAGAGPVSLRQRLEAWLKQADMSIRPGVFQGVAAARHQCWG